MTRPIDIAIGCARKDAIKAAKEPAERSTCFFARAKQQRGKRRAKRKCIESRNDNRDCNRYCELLIQPAGDPGKKHRRYKDRRKHTGNTYNRAGYLTHCLRGGFAWRHTILY